VLFTTAYTNFAFIIAYITVMVGILTLTTISYDEFENGMGYLFMLPVSRREYVGEKYLFSIVTTLPGLAAVSVFFALLERTVASLTRLSTLEQLFSPLFFYGTVTVLPQTLLFSSILFVGASLLSFFFGTPLLQGNVSWYYKRTEGEIFPVFRAFLWYASFRKWLKVLVVYLLLFLKKAFWTVLLLLPAGILYFAYCISVMYRADAWQSFILFFLSTGLAAGWLVSALIVCYRYFLVPYILADNPRVRILTAFRSSVQIMKGKKRSALRWICRFCPIIF